MNVIIVHGSFGKPFENWFPWAEQELSEKGIVCTIPTFPTPNYQNYDDWKMLLNYYYERGYINEESVLVGHSCGAAFIVKYLVDCNIRVKGIVTVSGYNNFCSGDDMMDGLNFSFYQSHDEINKITSLVERRVSFFSDNDPFIPLEKLEEFAEEINAEKMQISNAGHFNASAGYTAFEEVIKVLESFS